MPHAEIKYTSDLEIDASKILQEIEAVILRHDAGSGECKGRAYPANHFHHTHFLLQVGMLYKPHRDSAFTAALMQDLETVVKAAIRQSCYFSFGLSYSDGNYVTNFHEGA